MRGPLMATLFALASFSAACGDDPPPAPPPPGLNAHYWFDQGSSAFKDDLLASCAGWIGESVGCLPADGEFFATLRVYVDASPCVPDSNGSVALAVSYPGGKTVFYLKCLEVGGVLDEHMLTTVMMHEFGHQWGMWFHVARRCDGTAPIVDGMPVCGPALMNPYYDPGIDFVTTLDALAFQLRNPYDSALQDRLAPPDAGERPGCIYRVPAEVIFGRGAHAPAK